MLVIERIYELMDSSKLFISEAVENINLRALFFFNRLFQLSMNDSAHFCKLCRYTKNTTFAHDRKNLANFIFEIIFHWFFHFSS